MANLTYTAEISPPVSSTSPVVGSPYPISATISQVGTPANSVIIAFTVSTPVLNSNTAQITGIFLSPLWWSNQPTIQNVILTTMKYTSTLSSYTQVLVPITASIVSAGSSPTMSIATSIVPTGQSSTSGQSVGSAGQSTSTAVSSNTLSDTATSVFSPTQTTSSVTAQQTSSSARSHDKYNSAELAGVAVGCLVAGFLLAALVIALFLRRAHLRKWVSAGRFEKDGAARFEKEGDMEWRQPSVFDIQQDSNTGPKAVSMRLEELPQQESDDFIRTIASRTLDEIEMFVEEFYIDKLASNLSSFGPLDSPLLNSPYLNAEAPRLLATSTQPTKIIKHCVAYFLLQQISAQNNESPSLLPSEFKGMQFDTAAVRTQSLSNRQASSQLRLRIASTRQDWDQDKIYQAQRERVVTELVDRIESTFQAWSRGDATTRLRALKGVVIHVSQLGIKLFSQPSLFQWTWSQSNLQLNSMQGENTPVLLAPGLSKVTDQNGEILDPPLVLVSPRMAH